jgi:hypothetical protein
VLFLIIDDENIGFVYVVSHIDRDAFSANDEMSQFLGR